MRHSSTVDRSVRSISLRLFGLLLRAFTIVVLLTIVLVLALVGILIARTGGDTFLRSPLPMSLETYYLVQGGWQGVERVFADQTITASSEFKSAWQYALLVDNAGMIVNDGGRVDTDRVGDKYTQQKKDVLIALKVNGTQVGMLVFEHQSLLPPWLLAAGLLQPVILLSFLPAVLTLIIGMLLMRRVVTPLADVIAAAQSVAGGDFSARVEVCGPDDLRALSDSFNHMADALERSDCERRNMLADIAHELRTPLTVIRGRLEGILDGVYKADGESIAPVLAETYLLERLVEDLRLLTLAESRQLRFEMCPVDLGELVERAASLFEAEAAEKEINLTLDIQPDLPLVTADPQRVEQVIGNLLSNALRFTPAGGKVDMLVRAVPEGVTFQVSDSGPGVAKEDLPFIFERFWRGDRSRVRSAGGAGLGLAIARQLVEAQGGIISADNLPSAGLRVTFLFKALK